MDQHTLYFYSNCTDQRREDEYNGWYSYTHIPDLSNAKGLISAKRYINQDPKSKARYLATYEFCTDDIQESLTSFFQLVRQSFQSGRHIDCIESVNIVNTPFISCYKELEMGSIPRPPTLGYLRNFPEALKELEDHLKSLGRRGI
jgi:hypothetical protein